jgi:hypothetical protein
MLSTSSLSSGASYLNDFIAAGIKHFRIELVDEKPEDVIKLVNMYTGLYLFVQILDSIVIVNCNLTHLW